MTAGTVFSYDVFSYELASKEIYKLNVHVRLQLLTRLSILHSTARVVG
jgi:hypothetical protein